MDIEAMLKHSYLDALEKEKILRAFKARAIAAKQPAASWRSRSCPGCGSGLKLKATSGMTILVCASCSFVKAIPFLMNEARPLSEPYIPGVTSKPTPTVVMDAQGRIKQIIGA